MYNDIYGSFGPYSPTDEVFNATSEFITGFLAFFGAFYFLLVIAFLVVGVVYFIAQWKLYQKAGEAGWKCLIPFYNEWVRIRIALGRTSVGWFILSLVPILSILEHYYISFYFAKRYSGKDSIALLYLLLPLVTAVLMAYSNRYQYIANRDRVDSGRGGIDGDWPLWANEESSYRADDFFYRPFGQETTNEEHVRYDSRHDRHGEQARKPYFSPESAPNETNRPDSPQQETVEE